MLYLSGTVCSADYPLDRAGEDADAALMFVRCKRRLKDGKEHRYRSVVGERPGHGGRVVQRQVLYLGEINDSSERRGAARSRLVEGKSTIAADGAVFPRTVRRRR